MWGGGAACEVVKQRPGAGKEQNIRGSSLSTQLVGKILVVSAKSRCLPAHYYEYGGVSHAKTHRCKRKKRLAGEREENRFEAVREKKLGSGFQRIYRKFQEGKVWGAN